MNVDVTDSIELDRILDEWISKLKEMSDNYKGEDQ